MRSHTVRPASPLPLTPVERGVCLGGWIALAAWCFALLAGPSLLAHFGVAFNAHGHGHVYAHGHPFVDARSWLGIPNALDVLSNLPLLIAGLWGIAVLRAPALGGLKEGVRQVLAVFFWGLVLTSVGSSIYHWAPNAQGLVLDRLGMAMTFAGALGLAMIERVGASPVRNTLRALLLLGSLSAISPLTHDNVVPWVVVQFGGMAFMAWAAWRKPLRSSLGVSLGALLAFYALAKAFEMGDAAIFHATGNWVSGHSLKHMAAALAAWPVIRALRQNAHTTTAVSTGR